MKHISLFKIFTLVCFLVVGQKVFATYANSLESCRSSCDNLYDERDYTDKSQYARDIKKCKQECITTANSECKSAKSNYASKYEKALEECAKIGALKVKDCKDQVAACNKAEGAASGDMGNTVMSFYTMLSGASQNIGANGKDACYTALYENDDDFMKDDERLTDKVSDLQDKINDLREKGAEDDNKLEEKRTEAADKMEELKEEYNEKSTKMQTEKQEKAAALARKIIDGQAKKTAILRKIQQITTKSNNLAFAFQEIQLKYVDSEVTAKCLAERNALADAQLYKIDKNGKKTAIQFDKKTARLKRNAILAKESTCLANEALKKSAEIKGLNDQKQEFAMEIAAENDNIEQEQKHLDNDQKELNDIDTINSQQDAKFIETLNKKLNNLNQSVVTYEAFVTKKKKSYEDRIAQLNIDIKELQAKKARVKSRYSRLNTFTAAESNAYLEIESSCPSNENKTTTKSTGTKSEDSDK